jgi:hypothetical protein
VLVGANDHRARTELRMFDLGPSGKRRFACHKDVGEASTLLEYQNGAISVESTLPACVVR